MRNLLGEPLKDTRSRLRKGYDYESQVWTLLDSYRIDYKSNPKDYLEWLKRTGEGFDLRVFTVKKGWLKVEAKFTSKPIYHSWFVRDWLSRDAEIIVTNNIWHVPSNDRIMLKQRGIKLLGTFQFLSYIIRLNRVTRFTLNMSRDGYYTPNLDVYVYPKSKPIPDSDPPEKAYRDGLSSDLTEESILLREKQTLGYKSICANVSSNLRILGNLHYDLVWLDYSSKCWLLYNYSVRISLREGYHRRIVSPS
jgi:hypothetical protein